MTNAKNNENSELHDYQIALAELLSTKIKELVLGEFSNEVKSCHVGNLNLDEAAFILIRIIFNDLNKHNEEDAKLSIFEQFAKSQRK